MDPRLKRIVGDVKKEVMQNPPEDGADDSTVLIETIMNKGLGTAFSEDDMINAGLEMGVPLEDIPDFLEQFASYIPR